MACICAYSVMTCNSRQLCIGLNAGLASLFVVN